MLTIGIGVSAVKSAEARPAPHVAKCLDDAAAHHRVDPDLLHAIAAVESGFDPAAVNRANRNGSRDIGLMQINSWWLPRLAKYGIDEHRLFDPCVSAQVGAWILAGNIARLGATWRAVGAYNARSPARQAAYVRRVQQQLQRVAPRVELGVSTPHQALRPIDASRESATPAR